MENIVLGLRPIIFLFQTLARHICLNTKH